MLQTDNVYHARWSWRARQRARIVRIYKCDSNCDVEDLFIRFVRGDCEHVLDV